MKESPTTDESEERKWYQDIFCRDVISTVSSFLSTFSVVGRRIFSFLVVRVGQRTDVGGKEISVAGSLVVFGSEKHEPARFFRGLAV